jgi:hypothetical protein
MRFLPGVVAILLACASPAAAAATVTMPAALVPALSVYVDSIVAGHAAAAVCADAGSPARDEKGWAAAKAMLAASFWANGFPADFVADVAKRLAAPPGSDAFDCDDEAVTGNFMSAATAGWEAEIARMMKGVDLPPFLHPVPPDTWQAIRDAIAKESGLQARLFTCLEVGMPAVMPVSVHDWDDMLGKIGARLVAAGLPHDEIAAALSAAEANALWHPVAADARAGVVASCKSDSAWSDRFYTFTFLSLGSVVDDLLPPVEE